MRITLHWKRPLFYLLMPVFLFMIFVGFPPPIPPARPVKPSEEQTEALHEDVGDAA